MRSRILLGVFFLSGISALLYQIVWLKYLGLVFGNTVHAAATLIAIFLAGLGIGGYLFGRFFTSRHPLVVYAILEAVIGAIGAFSPNGFALLDDAYIASFHQFSDAPFALAVARAVFAALFLLPPTILMGATLPVLVRWMSSTEIGSGRAISSLYAVNTFGATAGVALAGFLTIPTIGLLATIFIAVLINFILAATSAALASRRPSPNPRPPSPEARAPINEPLILIAALLMGLTSIADEVFWTRILVLHLGSSVYAYSLMLFAFLIGLAVGSAAIYRVIDRVDTRRALAVLEIALAIVLALQVHYFTKFSDVLEAIARAIGAAGGYGSTLAVFLLGTLSALLIPTALMGATFPLAVRLYAESAGEGESRSTGIVYLFNTIGSILGSLLAGFILIRLVGSQNGLFLMAALNLAVAAFFLRGSSWGRAPWAAGVAILALAIALARPNQVILSAGLFADDKARVLLFREDVSATVTLRQFGPTAFSLELNGVNVAGTSPDLIGTQMLQGHLPLLMHPNPKKVLHIGFGSGGTAYAVSRHPVEEIRIAEISPEVLETSDQKLRMVNHGVLDDPRVRVEINDGRNFVLATPEKFDVILSDSIHPRYAGNGSLYTKDYFELCRAKLNPNGIISMWLPMYSLTQKNFVMILRAFSDVFPNTTVWYVPNHPNSFTIVIGRLEPGPVPLQRIAKGLTPAVRGELRQIGIGDPLAIADALMLDGEGVKILASRTEPHVDDLPAVEYESGRLIDRERSWLANFAMLIRASTPLARAFSGADAGVLETIDTRRRERNVRHYRFLSRQYGIGQEGSRP